MMADFWFGSSLRHMKLSFDDCFKKMKFMINISLQKLEKIV